jgi:hypothetical protein
LRKGTLIFNFENVWQGKDLQARFLDVWQVNSLNATRSKQTIVAKVGEDIRKEMEKSFDSMWATATALA